MEVITIFGHQIAVQTADDIALGVIVVTIFTIGYIIGMVQAIYVLKLDGDK